MTRTVESRLAVIEGETIARFPGTSPGDIFKSTPGVISAMSRNGAALNVNIRGIQNQNRVKVTVDGSEQATTTYRGYSGVDTRTYVAPDLIGGISIEKGPTGGASGAGAIGGVVAVRTLSADDILLGGKEFGVRLRGTLASNTIDIPPVGTRDERVGSPSLLDLDSMNGSFAVAAKKDTYELVVAVARQKSGNYFAGTKGDTTVDYAYEPYERDLALTKPGEEVFNTSQDMLSTLMKAKFTPDSETTLELGYLTYDNSYGEITPRLISTTAFRQVTPAQSNVQNLYANYKYDPVDNDLLNLRAHVWLTRTDETTQYGTNAYTTYPYHQLSNIYGLDLANTSQFSTVLGELKLEYGGSYSYERAEPAPDMQSATVVNGERAITGSFLRAELQPADWVTLGAGVRYDTYHTHDFEPVTWWTPYPDHDGGRLSPSANLTFTPFDGLQLFARYSEGMRPPALREVTRSSSDMQANPDLRPEIMRSTEFGINYSAESLFTDGDRFGAKLAYFDNRYEDYIARGFGYLANIDDVYMQGLEGQLSYDMGLLFADVSATYYIDVHYCDELASCMDGTDYSVSTIPPRFSASATGGVRLLDDALTLGGRLTYAGERARDIEVNGLIPLIKWNPYTIVDLFASYKVNENVTLDLGIDNVGDVYYLDAMGSSRTPAPGRTLRASITGKF